MHGFEFDGGGECVRLAYGSRPPKKARLQTYSVDEVDGFIYAYYSPDDSPPTWKLESLDQEGWTALRHRRLEFEGHPQEITENSVDFGHFKPIHHYSATVVEDGVASAERLTGSYRLVRPLIPELMEKPTFEVMFRVLAHGLGYSVVHADVQRPRISIRYFVNATPIDGVRTHLNLAAAIRKLPVPGLNPVVREAVFRGLLHDVAQDIPFWETKHHIEKPLLAEGDGPIGVYRRWCRQFYETNSGSSAHPGDRELSQTAKTPE
jgi:hypothetical protein